MYVKSILAGALISIASAATASKRSQQNGLDAIAPRAPM